MTIIHSVADRAATFDPRPGDKHAGQFLQGSAAIPGPIVSEPAAPVDPWLRDKEAARLLQVSTATFWRRVADGTISRPIKFGGMSRWSYSEILAVKKRAEAASRTPA